MRDSLRPMLSACELLCFVAVWACGLAALWSDEFRQAGRSRGASVAATEGALPAPLRETRR